MIKVKELRTVSSYMACRKCGLTMSPGSVVMVFERENEDAPWSSVGAEHPTACPGELMKKRPSMSAKGYVGSSWSG